MAAQATQAIERISFATAVDGQVRMQTDGDVEGHSRRRR